MNSKELVLQRFPRNFCIRALDGKYIIANRNFNKPVDLFTKNGVQYGHDESSIEALGFGDTENAAYENVLKRADEKGN